jgi:hypothetical protein
MLYQHKKKFLLSFFSFMTGIVFYACQREAEEPILSSNAKATLVVEVMHHQWTIPNIPVYLKKKTQRNSRDWIQPFTNLKE